MTDFRVDDASWKRRFKVHVLFIYFLYLQNFTHTHTHAHTQRERERFRFNNTFVYTFLLQDYKQSKPHHKTIYTLIIKSSNTEKMCYSIS